MSPEVVPALHRSTQSSHPTANSPTPKPASWWFEPQGKGKPRCLQRSCLHCIAQLNPATRHKTHQLRSLRHGGLNHGGRASPDVSRGRACTASLNSIQPPDTKLTNSEACVMVV